MHRRRKAGDAVCARYIALKIMSNDLVGLVILLDGMEWRVDAWRCNGDSTYSVCLRSMDAPDASVWYPLARLHEWMD